MPRMHHFMLRYLNSNNLTGIFHGIKFTSTNGYGYGAILDAMKNELSDELTNFIREEVKRVIAEEHLHDISGEKCYQKLLATDDFFMTSQLPNKLANKGILRPKMYINNDQIKPQKYPKRSSAERSIITESIYSKSQPQQNLHQNHKTVTANLEENLDFAIQDYINSQNSNSTDNLSFPPYVQKLLSKSQYLISKNPVRSYNQLELSEFQSESSGSVLSNCSGSILSSDKSDATQRDQLNTPRLPNYIDYDSYSENTKQVGYELSTKSKIKVEDRDIDLIWSNLVGSFKSYNTTKRDKNGDICTIMTDNEWENELAHRILKLHANKVTNNFVQQNYDPDETGEMPLLRQEEDKSIEHFSKRPVSSLSCSSSCSLKESNPFKPPNDSNQIQPDCQRKTQLPKLCNYVKPPIVPSMIWFGRKRKWEWRWNEIKG